MQHRKSSAHQAYISNPDNFRIIIEFQRRLREHRANIDAKIKVCALVRGSDKCA